MSKVALIDSEYSSLKSGLTNVHSDCLDQIDVVIKGVTNLNTKSGGFYADELTSKINDLISALSSIRNTMDSLFKEDEEMVVNFAEMVDNYDS